MEEYEYSEFDDGSGVKRANYDCLCLIQVDKSNAVEKIKDELGSLDFAGLYLLTDSDNSTIYIGESSNIKERIQQHVKKSPVPDFEFKEVIVIWDGRPITTTRFGNETFRKALEKECINVFDAKFSKYNNVNTVKNPKETNVYEKSSINRMKTELFFLLRKSDLIHTLPTV